jgi:hypothetical protein
VNINRKARRRANKLAMNREERKRVQALGGGAALSARERIASRMSVVQPALTRETERMRKEADHG